eukprot:c11888_g1_i1.p1 GENE.c11888_g1_i1~~c11888_g1_i1.p1  ORF type:complete len:1759 (+),score=205.64 c11888_g1_i1:31-5307(+)
MRSLGLCLASLLVSGVTSVLPKLPTLDQHQSVSVETGFNESSLYLPSEDIPLNFGTRKSQLETVAAISSFAGTTATQDAVTPEVSVGAGVTEWRPNDIHLVSTRQMSFTQSQPHLPGGNCHVSRVRALSHCPGKCSGHGVCGVSESQKGFKYIPSSLPGVCQCADGWHEDDCSVEAASQITSVLVTTGNTLSDTLSVPGNVVRVTLISGSNIDSVNVTSFHVGRRLVSEYVIMPDSGVSPCRVWHVAYLVAAEDFGEISFAISYIDYKSREGTVTSEDKVVRGTVTVTSFAAGALHWRLRALTISKGGTLEHLAWKISKISLFREIGQRSLIRTDSATVIASSEAAIDCGPFGTCSNVTFGNSEYRFAISTVSADPEAMKSKLLNFPKGFGKRARDPKTKKYVGTGPIQGCAAACESISECEAFTYGRTGCYLHARLTLVTETVMATTSTYFKLFPKCANRQILTCSGECVSDAFCRNHTSARPRPLRCSDLIGNRTCTAEQDRNWNCPLHGCNHQGCDVCGTDNFEFGKDLSNGMAEHAFDVYASHYWQAASNAPDEWIAITFPTKQTIQSILVEQPSITTSPWSVVFEQSNDLVNWMPIVVMDDFAALKYATDLPSPAEVAGATESPSEFAMRFVDFDAAEDQILADLGFSQGGNTLIPTVTYCYYSVDSDSSTDLFNIATYDAPIPQIAAKFFVPQNTTQGLRALPRVAPWKVVDGCLDNPVGWADKAGHSCDEYARSEFCTSDGAVGTGWKFSSPIEEVANSDGISALDACCVCGGGARFRPSTSELETPVALIELGQPTTQELLRDDLDEFGCPPTASWCAYTMTCIPLAKYDSLCRPPAAKGIAAPTVPATWFVFRDESRIPGVINGSLSIIAAYNDYKDTSISEYAVYFAKSENGRKKDLIGSPLLVLPKGPSILTGTIPNSVIPASATHLAVVTQNNGLLMAYGITRPLEMQLNIYGDLGTYHTHSCAVWRRNGPNYHDIQGFTVAPMKNFYKGKEMTIKISGVLHCSDLLDAHGTHVGHGSASIHWAIFHSRDGSNSNAKPITKNEFDATTFARGTFEVTDGQCVDFGNGVPIQGFVPRFQGGYVAIWMKLEWKGEDNGEDYALVCDDVTFEVVQGVNVDPDQAAEGEFYCDEKCKNGGADAVMVLEYKPRSKFSGTCTSDEGRVCVDEWVADGCGNNAPFVYGLDCEQYKSCYVEAMGSGQCGADLADSDCTSDEAVQCIDEWVESGCPNAPSANCVQYEECAIQAVLEGRCEALKIDCAASEAVACVEGWVTKGCGSFPPADDTSCAKFETCAAKAVEAGRCGAIVDCSVKEARLCVDEWVNLKCPGDQISTVKGTDCSPFGLCFHVARGAGRCSFPDPIETAGEEVPGETVTPGNVDAVPITPSSVSDLGNVVGSAGAAVSGVTNGVNGALGGATTAVNGAASGAASTAQQTAGAAGQAAAGAVTSGASAVGNIGNSAASSMKGANLGTPSSAAVSNAAGAVTNAAGSVQNVNQAANAVASNIPNVGATSSQATAAATGAASAVGDAVKSVIPGHSMLAQLHSSHSPDQWNQRRSPHAKAAGHRHSQHEDSRPHFSHRPGLRHLLRYKGKQESRTPATGLPQHQTTAAPAHAANSQTIDTSHTAHTTPMKRIHTLSNQLPPPPVHNQPAPEPVKLEEVKPVTNVDWKAINAASRQQWLRFMKSGDNQVEASAQMTPKESVDLAPVILDTPTDASSSFGAAEQPETDWEQVHLAARQKWLNLMHQPN